MRKDWFVEYSGPLPLYNAKGVSVGNHATRKIYIFGEYLNLYDFNV